MGLNSGVVICYIGNMGGGKTLSAVHEVSKYARMGYTIYSNIHLKFPYKKFTLQEFLAMYETDYSLGNTVIFIDEAHIWADSRDSQKKTNKVISYLVNQSRKRSIRIILTTQSFDQLEKRLRNRTDILTFCRKKSIQGEKCIMQEHIIGYNGMNQRMKKTILKASPIYRLYDTNEIVSVREQ